MILLTPGGALEPCYLQEAVEASLILIPQYEAPWS